MRVWYLIVAQARSLVLRRRRQDELDEELRLHLEQEIAQHVARGLSPEEARRSALRAFGGVDKTKEECRDAWGLRLVDHLARDTRYATRRLARDWRFTLLAVAILALGIGANTPGLDHDVRGVAGGDRRDDSDQRHPGDRDRCRPSGAQERLLGRDRDGCLAPDLVRPDGLGGGIGTRCP